ncbi:MAG: hypothetical protein QXP01_04905, partial [Candidatus Hadarchaeum sp.]
MALTGVVITSTPGRAVATKTMIVELESAGTNETVTLRLRAGDVIYLTTLFGGRVLRNLVQRQGF